MKRLFLIFAAAVLLGVQGCNSADSDKIRYGQIAEKLDTGGSCYFISSSRNAGATLKSLIKQCEDHTWSSDLPAERLFRMQQLISSVELIGRVAGIDRIQGWGGSSRQIPSSKEVLFRNKFRLLLPEKKSVLLRDLFSADSHPLEKQLYNLPRDTFFAGAVYLTPEVLTQYSAYFPELFKSAAEICKILTGMSLDEFFKAAAGVWKAVVVCDEVNDFETFIGFHISLSVPDKDNKLFKALSTKAKLLPGSVVDLKKGSIKLEKIPEKMLLPCIFRGKDRLIIATTPNAIRRTGDGNSFPQLPEFIRKLSKYTDLNGSGVFYCRDLSLGLPVKTIDLEAQKPSLSVMRPLKDGLFIENISSRDLNSYALLSSVALPLRAAFELFFAPSPADPQPPAPAAAPRKKTAAPRPAAKAPVQRKAECTSGIKTAGDALMKAAAGAGAFPPYGIAGLRSLVSRKMLSAAVLRCPEVKLNAPVSEGLNYANCSYLYFGQPAKGSPKTPVLMEHPLLHREHFSLFYADGSVEKIQLSGRRSVRRAISYLHTVHSYEEEEFMRLIKIASEFDKILEL